MFKYIVSKIKICNGEIERSTMLQLNDSVVENFLQDYENEIIIFLKNKNESFSYLQGKLRNKFFQECLKKSIGNYSSSYNIFNLTHHPSFVGGKIINNFLDYGETTNNYIITYENPLGNYWLNSGVSYKDVISDLTVLNEKTRLKNNIEINFIRIYESSLIKFTVTNPGSNNPKYKILK